MKKNLNRCNFENNDLSDHYESKMIKSAKSHSLKCFLRYRRAKKKIIYRRVTSLRNSIKIRKTLNRCNMKDNNPRSMSERSLETWILALWNALWFISIQFPVPETVSSCKVISLSFTTISAVLVAYPHLSSLIILQKK